VTAHERGNGAPALVWGHIEAGDGSLWSLRTSWLLPGDASIADCVEVYGSLGAEQIKLTADDYDAALDAEIAHFCACVRKRETSSVVTLTDAAHGIRVAEALIASAAAGGSQIEIPSME
jgi:predicted dehydrogenase